MSTRKKKNNIPLVLFMLIAAGAGGYLFIAKTTTNTVYFFTVKEVMASTELPDKAIRVSGIVQEGSISRDPEQMLVEFKVADDAEHVMPVSYRGPVPDIFNDNVEVVLEGRLKEGIFVASNLLAKCPSKYQKSGSPDDFKDVGQPAGSAVQGM